MRELISPLIDALRANREVACCRLVETRGSTPQKAGASMLVFADGSQLGTLGGGCVEADVKRQALVQLAQGTATLAQFQLDDDYGWDDGLICGGRMHVLIEPAHTAAARDYFERFAQLLEQGGGAAEAIVFDAEASGLQASATYLFAPDGTLVAQLRAPLVDGTAPLSIHEALRPLDQRPAPRAERGIAFLPILPRTRMVIVGGGHVGQAVAKFAVDLDFDVWVVDDRETFVSEERFPRAERRIVGLIGQVLPSLEITPNTFCLIVTRGHNHDEEALYHLVDRGARYVGMIGSRRKIKLIFDDLRNEGVSEESLSRVHAPVGLEIGSQTVPEIAVSIAAELVACRNLPDSGPRPGNPKVAAARRA